MLQIAGMREFGHAAALLIPRRAGWGAWTRVAGDIMDLAACGQTMRNRGGERRRRLMYATGAVAGITAVDLYTALRTTRARPMNAGNRVHASVRVNRSVEEDTGSGTTSRICRVSCTTCSRCGRSASRRSRWTAKAPAGRSVEWEAEVVADRPNELIMWRSAEGSKVPNSGSVRFQPATGGRGTEVRVELEFSAPGRRLGALVAKAFGENPQQQVCDDLRRFKQVIETGEIVRSDGSPQGTSMQQQAKQRAARPLATPRVG
ncbi:cyclase [Micromonospora echinaurantiaca]|uniref:cyclase n=1 Tax=Micromonospora echinaurantiaca TaxID=47857 RepID=UPI0037B080E3